MSLSTSSVLLYSNAFSHRYIYIATLHQLSLYVLLRAARNVLFAYTRTQKRDFRKLLINIVNNALLISSIGSEF